MQPTGPRQLKRRRQNDTQLSGKCASNHKYMNVTLYRTRFGDPV